MRLTLSSFVLFGTAALFAGCGTSDPATGGSAGSGGSGSGTAGAPSSVASAGAGGKPAGSAGSGGTGTSVAGGGSAGAHAGAAGSAGSGVAGGGSAGSPGAAGGGSTIPGTFADAVKPVIGGGGSIVSCSAQPCHAKGSNSPPGSPLTLPINDDAVLYTSLTTYTSKGCGNIPLVKKGDPEGSALVKILRGTCPSPTMRMPLDCTGDSCIPDDYIAAIAQWIKNGAPQ